MWISSILESIFKLCVRWHASIFFFQIHYYWVFLSWVLQSSKTLNLLRLAVIVCTQSSSNDVPVINNVFFLPAEVREKIRKRGIKTYTGLGRYYRERDERGDGVMYRFQLEKGLFTFHIDLDPEVLLSRPGLLLRS